MSNKQLSDVGVQRTQKHANWDMQDQLTDEERKKRQALTQSQFREMISLNPDKQSKASRLQHNDTHNLDNIGSQKKNQKKQQDEKGKDEEEYQENDNEEQNDTDNNKWNGNKKKIQDLQNSILTVLVLESVEILSDLIQYVELKVKNNFSSSWEDTLLGFSTIFALAFTLVIGWIYKLIFKQEIQKKKIINFYNSYFYNNILNRYCVFLIIYMTVLDILRFETYLLRIDKRLHTLITTFIVNQTILARLNKGLSNCFVLCSTLYMTARYLVQNHDYAYLFIGSIITSFAISYRYYFLIYDQLLLDKQRNNQQFMTEYFKQFYHNIVSMMPQGILIIDESEKLVYANKTTKKILSCKTKNSIIDSLKNLIVQDPSKLSGDANEDTKTIKETKTLKSFKSLKSNHIKKPFVVHNSNNTNSNYNTNNIAASDSESFVSAYQFQDGFYASPLNTHQKQSVIKPVPVRDKQGSNVTVFQNIYNHLNQQGNSNSSKQNQQRNSISSNMTFQQQSYPITQNQLDKNTTQMGLQQSIPMVYKNSSTSMNNDVNLNTGGVISKITTTVEAISTQFGQKPQERKPSIKNINNNNSPQEDSQTLPHAAYQIYTNSNPITKQNITSNNLQYGTKEDKNDLKQVIPTKRRKNMPFKYLQSTGLQSQKNFENLSVMDVISVLLKECVIKLRGGDPSEIQANNSDRYPQNDLSECNQNLSQYSKFKKEDQNIEQNQNNPQTNTVYKSQKSSLQKVQRDPINKLFSQVSGSQKTFQRNPESAGSNAKYYKLSQDNYQSLSNNASSYPQNVSSVNHTVKNNTELAQNSLSIRVKIKDKLIEITFIQCEARLFSNNNLVNKQEKINSSLQNNKSQFSEKDSNFRNRVQSNLSAAAAQTSHQLNNDPNSTAIILVFLEDITQEVIMKRLEEINNYKVKMLSSISHELKTPLNCSMGMLDDILNFISTQDFGNPQTAQKIRESLEPAQQSNQLLLYMIRDLIDLGTFELFEKFKYEYSKFNLKNLLLSCIDIMRFQGQLKYIEMNLYYDHQLDEFVVSDENRVRQIVVNFLTNSLKFTQKNGKIAIKAELSTNNHIKISVEDNGIGIPSKKLPEIFQLYNRAESHGMKKSQTQGIGIGLSVSYRLAQGLTTDEFKDQPIQVKSEEKKGSTFSFILKNQDSILIDDTHRENDVDDEYNQQTSKLGTQFQRRGESDIDEINYDRSQTFTNTKHTHQNQYDIPEDFDQEEEEDKENGNQNERSFSPIKKGGRNHKYTSQYSENILEGDENIDDESEIRLKLERGDITPNVTIFQKYFQNDTINQRDRFSEKDEHFESISKHQLDMTHLPHQADTSILDVNKEQSQLNSNNKQATLIKLPSLSYMTQEDSMLIKLGSHNQNGNGIISSFSGLNNNQSNNQVQNSPCPLSPYSSYQSFVNIEMQQTIEEFIQQNLQKKSEFFKEEYGQILIVDDVQFNLLMLQNLLKKYQMKVDIAHDGQEAFNKVKEKYEKMNSTYRVIFMDIQMPIMDGFQATKEIKKFLQEKKVNQIPIIAISAFADQQYKEQSKKVGMTDYIEKPVQTHKIDRAFLKYIIK